MSVGVLIPAYNAGHFIGRAIHSALDQTLPPTQIVVVDDGSEDDTEKVCGRLRDRIQYIRVPHAGKSVARNIGMSVLATDYIAFLDADDEFLPSHLDQLMAVAERNGADVFYDCVESPYFMAGRRPPRRPQGKQAYRHLSCYQLWLPASMVSAEFVRRLGVQFDPGLEIGEDLLFMARLIVGGARIRYVRRYGIRVGRHGANTTGDPGRVFRQTAVALGRVRRSPELTKAGQRELLYIRELRKGRAHNVLLWLAHRIYHGTDQGHSLKRMMRLALTPGTPVRWQDRSRSFVIPLWMAAGRPRRSWLVRRLFGYGIAT